jgi:hypothetical protein
LSDTSRKLTIVSYTRPIGIGVPGFGDCVCGLKKPDSGDSAIDDTTGARLYLNELGSIPSPVWAIETKTAPRDNNVSRVVIFFMPAINVDSANLTFFSKTRI